MRILITGGAGFIGSHLVQHFQGSAEIVVLDNLRSGYLHNLDGLAHTFVKGSVTDRVAVDLVMKGVNLVFHLAAMTSVPESMDAPQECVSTNVLGLLNVLESATAAGVQKFVLASSAAIYGDNPTVPKTEDMMPEPKSPYAISKLDGEYYLEMFRREGKLETASLRFFNVFGPRQDPRSAYAAAVPIFMRQAFANQDITIFGDGKQTRDFVYVKDVIASLSHVGCCDDLHGTFNVGCGESMRVKDLARLIIRLSGSTSNIKHQNPRLGDIKHSLASIDKLKSAGFNRVSTMELGISKTLDFFRSSQDQF